MTRIKVINLSSLKLRSLFIVFQTVCLTLFLGGMVTQALSEEEDSRFKISEYVRDNVLQGEYGNRTIWISSQPVDSSFWVRSLDKEEQDLKIPYEGWVVMIDDEPRANWGHKVRWLVVKVDLEEHTLPQLHFFPPRVFAQDGNEIPVACLEGATTVPCESAEVESATIMRPYIAPYLDLTDLDKECLHAMLISGGINDGSNHERYRTNLRSMYTILLNEGYPKSNIFVYYADGSSLDLDNADSDDDDSTGNDVNDSADEAIIRLKLQEMCDNLQPVEDYLFVYVSDHGSGDGSICLWDFDDDGLDPEEKYSPAEMATDTENCQVCRLFMLHDQCFSGAFLPLATDGNHDNTTVYAAATADESSYGREYLDYWEDLDHDITTLEDLHQDVVDNATLNSTPGKNEVDEANDQVFLNDCCENTPPVADANGPYMQDCQGTQTTLTLDGTGSFDPDEEDTLTYAWSTTDCPGGVFDDNASVTPVLTVNTSPGCSVACNVFLTVTDLSGASDEDSTLITVLDTIPPDISCPSDSTIECDESTDPFETGMATVTDACDSNPTVTFTDVTTPGTCPAAFSLSRTWIGTDYCGNTNSCVQEINVVDTTPPVIECNAPGTITPPEAPISFTATATDNCDSDPLTEITSYDCYTYTKKGKETDKKESCVVSIVNDTVTVMDSGGVGTHISWMSRSTDSCGNITEQECETLVVNPAQ
ncbi:C13 family peptidase [Desulfopila sp. IMCC35008]|uniref:C13 family peptidase n=1 Tax=Desulfopila sp. IMCC35008 TaxID=2653858 RepID=UPI0013D1A8ED|nr:C13 family peptidase [Desulfopila sp. IMCC35008]